MNEDLDTLEEDLRRIQPRKPSRGLMARIGDELERPTAGDWLQAAWSLPSWRWAAGLATAAAIAGVVAGAAYFRAPADVFHPVSVDNILYATEDDGLVTLDDGSPARQIRTRYLDTITWVNPRTDASLQWTVPRDEIRILPVIFY